MSSNVCIVSPVTQQIKACIPLKYTRTPEEQRLGMMYQAKMDYALAFVYSDIAPRRMWMKNVKFPLDMVFCRKNVIVQIQGSVPVCDQPECPVVESLPSDLVLELPGGWASSLHLRVGDIVTYK